MNISPRWSIEQANEWYARQPWLVGCNFIPSSAINQLEMWQVETFDPAIIDCELGWAASIGFNTVRTFLHDLAWEADPAGFKERLNFFLEIAYLHGIRPIIVIFDDCWNPNPKIGSQPAPRPGIHNSGWLQSPSLDVVNRGASAWFHLERYVTDIIGSFANDKRILFWDLYNEPGNNGNAEKSLPLVQYAFEWARGASPSQPLSVGLWNDYPTLNEFQLAASDIITFHNYYPEDNLIKQIKQLKEYGRPVICTEYMARTQGSLFEKCLPIFRAENVGCFNWGLVSGKTQTIYPWESPGDQAEPELWFHDIFHSDGTPYRLEEIDFIRGITKWKKV